MTADDRQTIDDAWRAEDYEGYVYDDKNWSKADENKAEAIFGIGDRAEWILSYVSGSGKKGAFRKKDPGGSWLYKHKIAAIYIVIIQSMCYTARDKRWFYG